MTKWGVFLARMQPLHNGHLELIKKALEENDYVLVLVGSSDKLEARNPIPGTFRRDLLERVLQNIDVDHRVTIELLPDLTTEDDNSHDWGFYLYANVVRVIGQHCFTMYYSDGWEIITKWFPGFLLRNSVDLRLVARNNCENGISATEVRRDLVTCCDDALHVKVPDVVWDNREILRAFCKVWM